MIMSIAEKLRKLLNIKAAIKDALFFVGQEVADKMEDWAMAIRNICNVPFENLGYDEEEATFYNKWIRDAYANGKKIKDNASTLASLTLYSGQGLPNLDLTWDDPIFFPNTTFPKASWLQFSGNTNILILPNFKLETGNYVLTSNQNLLLRGVKIIRIKNDTITSYTGFEDSVESIHLNFLNVKSGNAINKESGSVAGRRLTDIRIDNIGTRPEHTSFTAKSRLLGINTKYYPNARANLIYTLLDSSYDRASAGYSVFTIALSQETFDLLTEEEITAITQKGYTIAV